MTGQWQGMASEAPASLWVDGDVVWDGEPGAARARQVARIDDHHIWQLDARGRDAGLLGLLCGGGEVVGPDRRTTIGYVDNGEAVVLRALGRHVVGTTEPPHEGAAAVGLLLSYGSPSGSAAATTAEQVVGMAVLATDAWRARGQKRLVERYGSRYQEMEGLQAAGETEGAVAAARALREDLLADRKARGAARQVATLLAAGAALVELSSTSRVDFALAAETDTALDGITDPALETEVLKLRTHLAVVTGRLDDAVATVSELTSADPENPVYGEMAARLSEAVQSRNEAAKVRSREMLAAAQDGLARAQGAADRFSELVARGQELESEFATMFGDGQKLTFPRSELPARLEAAEVLHGRVRALLADIDEGREGVGVGRVTEAAGRLRAPVEALDATLVRITDTMRRGMS